MKFKIINIIHKCIITYSKQLPVKTSQKMKITMKNLYHNNRYITDTVKIHIDIPPLNLIKSNICLNMERDYVKIKSRTLGKCFNKNELKLGFLTMESQSNSFCYHEISIIHLERQERLRSMQSFNIYVLYYVGRRDMNSKLCAFKLEVQLSHI